ncbi:hypothetical protein CC78DRAFT_530087 [Lojkania enalia]|uniref:Zn(2)-C6 fungal-type domain-containing protein n=1 Tax=Lojkania enalia TaxID=147567 RepID=A0A9P4KJD3_9PLEO|nr:hypothetical protein CC78DRAFT_530087 [Didymosphaeria enalia]
MALHHYHHPQHHYLSKSGRRAHYQSLAGDNTSSNYHNNYHLHGLYQTPASPWQQLQCGPAQSPGYHRPTSANLPLPGNYNNAGPADYANAPQYAHPTWEGSGNYVREIAWGDVLSVGAFTTRQSGHYGEVVGRLPTVPHGPSPAPDQLPSGRAHTQIFDPCNSRQQDGFHELPTTQHVSVPPPATRNRASSGHRPTMNNLLNHSPPIPSSHEDCSLVPASWPAGASILPATAQSQQHPQRLCGSLAIAAPLSSNPGTVSPGTLSNSSWGMVCDSDSPSMLPTIDNLPDTDRQGLAEPSQVARLNHIQYPHEFYHCYKYCPSSSRSRARRANGKKDDVKVPSQRAKKNKPSKRTGQMTGQGKAEAHIVRKKGACFRCVVYKTKCDGNAECSECLKKLPNARMWKIPCIRFKWEDIMLLRHCNGRFNQDNAEFLRDYDWIQQPPAINRMDIRWTIPGIRSGSVEGVDIHLSIGYSEYRAEQANMDTTTSPHRSIAGNKMCITQPAYAIYDTGKFQEDLHRHIAQVLPHIEVYCVSTRVNHDPLAQLTFREVWRMQMTQNSTLLNLTMQIMGISLLSQGYGTVTSDNVPRIKYYDYSTVGYSSYQAYNRPPGSPLPIAINHQMDVAMLNRGKDLERLFRKLLKKIFHSSGNKPWYEIFLSLFVLFWNLDYVCTSAKEYVDAKCGTHIQDQVRRTVERQIAMLEGHLHLLHLVWLGALREYRPFEAARVNPDKFRTKGLIPDDDAFGYVNNVLEILHNVDNSRRQQPISSSLKMAINIKSIENLFREAGAFS